MNNFDQQWSNLGNYLSSHMLITVIPLFAGIIIGLPLAIFVVRYKRLQWPTLAGVGIIQTIPSLALLALMVPTLVFLGNYFGADIPSFGFLPAVIALTLYSLLPIVRNTVTGINNVESSLLEAGRAIGMTPRQILFKVQIPIAAPVILAGIRTATVWVVGTATLATPVGQTSLGNYIFSGLQTRNWTAVLFGCVSAALLALVLDFLLGLVEKGWSERRRSFTWTGLAGLFLFFGIGMMPVFQSSEDDHEGTIKVGAKTFTEQYILAELIHLRLAESNIPSQRVESLGSTVAFDALVNGEIDVYVDYSGTIWTNYMKRRERADPDTVLQEISEWVQEKYNATMLGALGFENTYAVAMRSAHAKSYGLQTIEDLSRVAPKLVLGSDYEFLGRPEWKELKGRYGLKFQKRQSFDSTFMYEAIKNKEVDVISAFSSDGRIAAYDLVVLDDNRRAFPPYDAVILVSPQASQNPEVMKVLSALVGKISIREMREANKSVDLDGLSPAEAARSFTASN